jgi:hypothetical protein
MLLFVRVGKGMFPTFYHFEVSDKYMLKVVEFVVYG